MVECHARELLMSGQCATARTHHSRFDAVNGCVEALWLSAAEPAPIKLGNKSVYNDSRRSYQAGLRCAASDYAPLTATGRAAAALLEREIGCLKTGGSFREAAA